MILGHKPVGIVCKIHGIVNIINLENWLIWGWYSHIESSSASRELLELHNVACQGACLVWEDILHLTKLLVDIAALGAAVKVLIFVIHIGITVHEHTLEEFDHLERDKERYWYEVAENEDPRASHRGYNEARILLAIVTFIHAHVRTIQVVDGPEGAKDSTCQWKEYL